MAVRNFYVDASIPGRATHLTGGPRNKEDGMDIKLYIRNEGDIETALSINCSVDEEGILTVNVVSPDEGIIHTLRRRR